MAATLEVLAEDGLLGVTVEKVASRAGVHKTTVYRRWPAITGLVADAIRDVLRTAIPMPDTGSVRDDLRQVLREARAFLTSPEHQPMIHAALAAWPTGELTELLRELWATRFSLLGEVVERGIERGELPADIDRRFVLEVLTAPLYFRIFIAGETVDDDYLDRVVDFVLDRARVP